MNPWSAMVSDTLLVLILLIALAVPVLAFRTIALLFLRMEDRDLRRILLSVSMTSFSGAGVVWLSTRQLQTYGEALFIGLPIYCGVLPVIIYSWRQARTHAEALGITCLTLLVLGVCILLFALDGLICILMAAPLAFVFTGTAAFITNSIMRNRHFSGRSKYIAPMVALCASLPFLVGFESRLDLSPPASTVVTFIDIAATPEQIWKYIPVIPRIRDAPELIFRGGIAYPIGSEMRGGGIGAQRLCILSTGPMTETVTQWEPGRLLKFNVTSCPPAMRELSIYPDLHTVHLNNFMVSEWGQFKLIPIDAGHTRVEGTSRYHNRMWPSSYWMPISDWIVHRIHLRVLHFIKSEAEREAALSH